MQDTVAISERTIRWLGKLAGIPDRELSARFRLGGELISCNLPQPEGPVFAKTFDTGGGTCSLLWNSQAAIPGAGT